MWSLVWQRPARLLWQQPDTRHLILASLGAGRLRLVCRGDSAAAYAQHDGSVAPNGTRVQVANGSGFELPPLEPSLIVSRMGMRECGARLFIRMIIYSFLVWTLQVTRSGGSGALA